MPVGDLYQDEISKNMLFLNMEPKYNTVFTDGKKMLYRSAGKLGILFFYLETNKDGFFTHCSPLFVFPLLVLS